MVNWKFLNSYQPRPSCLQSRMIKAIKEFFYVKCKNATLSLGLNLTESVMCKMYIAFPINRAKSQNRRMQTTSNNLIFIQLT